MKKILLLFLVLFSLIGCTVYKTIKIESQPSGVNINKGGVFVGKTPFEMKVGAGDVCFCTPSYWSFELEASPPANFTPINKTINPCAVPNNSKVFFNFGGTNFGGNLDSNRNLQIGAPSTTASISVDIGQDLPNTKENNRDAIAVVIGNRDYQKAKNVEFAINDAQAIRLYLTEVLGYRNGNILYKENATKGDFELFFGNKETTEGKLYDYVKPGRSDVFVYYSGHGAPGLRDKKGYFMPVEADPNYVELGGYSADVLYKNLSQLPAKSLTVVLDSCFSGAGILKNISPMVVQIENPILNMTNAVVLTSSQGSQVSSWYNEKKHGMFTYFFLKAIHDKNADFNKDNKLSYDEIFRFVSDSADGVPYYARREHSVIQTPTIEGQYMDKTLVQYK